MVLLHSDVSGLLVGPFDLVLLLGNRREPGSPCRVGQNVPHIVVTEQQRGAIVTADGMIAEAVHLLATRLSCGAESRTSEGLTEQSETQTEHESRTKLRREQGETETCNRRSEQPVAGVGH